MDQLRPVADSVPLSILFSSGLQANDMHVITFLGMGGFYRFRSIFSRGKIDYPLRLSRPALSTYWQ